MSRRQPIRAAAYLAAVLLLLGALDAARAQAPWPPWQSYGEAEEAARARQKRTAKPKQAEIDAASKKADELRQAGKYPEALTAAQRALRLTERRHGATSAEAAAALTALADLYIAQNRFAEAEPLLKRALTIREKAKKPDDAAVAQALDNLGSLYLKQGRTADAAPLAQRAADLRAKAQPQAAAPAAKNGEPAEDGAVKTEAPKASATRAADKEDAAPAEVPAEESAPQAAAPEQSTTAEAPAEPVPKDVPGAPETTMASPPPLVGGQGAPPPAPLPTMSPRTLPPVAMAPPVTPPPAQPSAPAPKADAQAQAQAQARAEEAAKAAAEAEARHRLQESEAARKLEVPGAAPPAAPPAAVRAAPRLKAAPSAPPVAAAKAAEEQKDWDLVPVFYGTDRAVEPNAQRLVFGSDRARRLQLGQALVTVPKGHQVPQVERPWAIRIPYFDVTIYAQAEDPKQHFTIKEIKALTKAELVALVKARLKGSQRFKDHALVFVHGYNTSFDNALYRTAQIAYDLEFDGAPFLYSWPSGGAVASYTYDRESAQASEPYLRQFLDMVVKETGAKSISIIAHSMGNQPVMDVLRDMKSSAPKGVVISQVILAAPDVDADTFTNLAQAIKGLAKGVTLYAAANDRALIVSRNFWGNYRAGDVPASGPLVLPGIDTIDVTGASTDAFAINHSGYAQNNKLLKDIGKLILDGLRPPDKRLETLKRVSTDKGDYWRYVGEP